MKKNNLKIDPTSPYYRVCLFPRCSQPFMTTRGRIYCCDKCADDHYNENRKLKKLKLERRSMDFEEEAPITIPEGPVLPSANKSEPETPNINQSQLEKNIEVFSSLSIDKKNGTIYSIKFLEDLEVDLRHYSYFFPLCNVKNGFCVMFGNFLTYLVSPLEILIFYKP